MMLGVMMFFDGALLALGNVSPFPCYPSHSELVPDSLRLRPHPYYRPQEDILLLRAQTKAPRYGMLSGWHRARLHQVAICRHDRGDLWLPEPLWVRASWNLESVCPNRVACSDFFPVIVTFLRQLPFIGTALSLPYIRDVSFPWPAAFTGCLFMCAL